MLPPLSEAEMLLRSNKTTRIYLVYTAAAAATTPRNTVPCYTSIGLVRCRQAAGSRTPVHPVT